ncbi:hypothetical protein DNHGIG_28400 [Collibacillus ludicampi]|uniref:Uncharacterized protein n=1 Tax=Collibacillus ludicampi TaxID=2771369 RepID=A0AAV4LHR8_9BACL|nr:hypothetical protein DNHGIG_28400 [Collibacillus ludicampi]
MDMTAVITGIAGAVVGFSGAIERIEAKVIPLLHSAKELFELIPPRNAGVLQCVVVVFGNYS